MGFQTAAVEQPERARGVVEAVHDRHVLGEALRRCREFADASAEQIAWLAGRASMVELADRALLYREGQPAQQVYVPVHGCVRVEYPQPGGAAWLFVDVEPRTLVGWRDVVRDGRRMSRVRAAGRCRLVAVPADDFAAYLAETPDAVTRLVRDKSVALRAAVAHATDLGTVELRRRLAAYLMALPSKSGYLTVPLTHSELASFVGATRQSVSQLFTEFRRRGWLEPDGRFGWHVLNPDALGRLAHRATPTVRATSLAAATSAVRPSVAMLTQHEAMAGLPESVVRRIADVSSVVRVGRGQRLSVQGSGSGEVWLIYSGLVRREVVGHGGSRLVLDVRSAPLVGAHQALSAQPWLYSVITFTAVHAVVVPRTAFRDIAGQWPAVGRTALAALADELSATIRSAAALACLSPATRLARHLVSLADAAGDIRLEGNQRDLAEQLAVSRQTVNHLVSQLVNNGVIARAPGRNHYHVLAWDRLEEQARLDLRERTRLVG